MNAHSLGSEVVVGLGVVAGEVCAATTAARAATKRLYVGGILKLHRRRSRGMSEVNSEDIPLLRGSRKKEVISIYLLSNFVCTR
jgi:hypothetical protein